MLRSLLLQPAGVDVHLVFDHTISPEFIAETQKIWRAHNPQEKNTQLSPGKQLSQTVYLTLKDGMYMAQKLKETYGQQVRVLQIRDSAKGQEHLAVDITMKMLEALSGQLTLLHAAALADPSSKKTLVLIGPSGRGKTTAARYLGQHLTYLSDETAVIEKNSSIRPYPKPLSIIKETGQPKIQYDPTSLGLHPAQPQDHSYRLHRIILLNRQEEASSTPASLQTVELADALIEIVQQSSGLAHSKDGIPNLIQLIQNSAGVVRLNYQDINQTLGLVQEILATETKPLADTAQTHPGPSRQTQADKEADPDQPKKLERAAGSCLYQIGQRALIHQQDQLLEISPFAADCWLSLQQPKSWQQVQQELSKKYGPIPDQALIGVLEELKKEQLLA